METAHASARPSSAPPVSPTRGQHIAAWYGLIGVPLVWIAHVLLCMGLVAITCPGGVTQRNAIPWSVVQILLAIASAAALALALAGVLATQRAWRESAALSGGRRETFRFVAWCGAAISVAFTLGLAFTISVLVTLPLQRLCEALR